MSRHQSNPRRVGRPPARRVPWVVLAGVGAAVAVVLVLLFPAVALFVRMAAKSALHLWWLILIAVIAIVLIVAGLRTAPQGKKGDDTIDV